MTPDGYDLCPRCGHHTSACVAGQCTVVVPYPEGDPRGMAGYCGCNCYEALHGESFHDMIIKALWGES